MPENYKLSSELVDEKTRVRPIPSRVDYRFFNYCSTCAIKYSKEILRYKECNQKIRTKPWHRSKLIVWKRI